MIIKIDMDGVIRNIIPTMLKIYNSEFNENLKETDITVYNVNTSFPKFISEKGKLATDVFFVDNDKEIFLNSNAFIGSKEAIDMLHRAGHKIIICTWQITYEAKQYTLEFLENNKIYYDDICFTKDKQLIKSDIIIDDNIEFLERDLSDNKICISAAYNREWEGKKYDSLYSFVIDFLKI